MLRMLHVMRVCCVRAACVLRACGMRCAACDATHACLGE